MWIQKNAWTALNRYIGELEKRISYLETREQVSTQLASRLAEGIYVRFTNVKTKTYWQEQYEKKKRKKATQQNLALDSSPDNGVSQSAGNLVAAMAEGKGK